MYKRQALDWLRKKGQKVAAKRADRDANEGVVIAKTNEAGTTGIVMAVSCETDFVAKNDGFIEFANNLCQLALDKLPETKEEYLALEFDGATVAEKLVEKTGTIGEKLEISGYHKVIGEKIASYIHAGSKIGVLVNYKDGGNAEAPGFFRSVAMHIAAMAPTIMRPEELDLEFVKKETEALQAQIKAQNEVNEAENLGKAIKMIPEFGSRLQMTPEVIAAAEAKIKEELAAEGKPEKIWDKIVPGKLERYISDNSQLDQTYCLLSQVYALDDTKTVAQAIQDMGDSVESVSYTHLTLPTILLV